MFSLTTEQTGTIHVAVDTKKRLVHLLEDMECGRLAQSMTRVQQQILSRIGTFGDPCAALRWIVYDAAGKVCEYRDGKFADINLANPDLHAAFVRIVKVRKVQGIF